MSETHPELTFPASALSARRNDGFRRRRQIPDPTQIRRSAWVVLRGATYSVREFACENPANHHFNLGGLTSQHRYRSALSG